MSAASIMVQGTMSSAGKSLLVTGLCRIYARRGLRVAPYKSQNMSNNAGVCPDGAEIGRAQYTQALACGIEPRAEMNPVLVKPEADDRSQVVLMGTPYASLAARDYYKHKDHLWGIARQALDRLREENDLVMIEGAGSPVELNLKPGDFVNMAVAQHAKAGVLLAGDIDRGGIFAQMLGTLWLLEPEERRLVKGLLVNKFRGDISLFENGVRILEEKGGVPVVGVIPYIHHNIPEEDAVAIEAQNTTAVQKEDIDLAVVRLPRISNFDDFDPLRMEPGVGVRYFDSIQDMGVPDAVILPGTKNTLGDMAWVEERGLGEAIRNYAAQGGAVVGICGGYQMLGLVIRDPEAVETRAGETTGLGLISAETVFRPIKETHQVTAIVKGGLGWVEGLRGERINGYEIHMGETYLTGGEPWLEIRRRGGVNVSVLDGGMDADGGVWGSYLHGIFENARLRRAWLRSLGWRGEALSALPSFETAVDELADAMEAALDMDYLDRLINEQAGFV